MSKLIVFLVLLAVYSGIVLAKNANTILSSVNQHYSQLVNDYGCKDTGGLTTHQCIPQ